MSIKDYYYLTKPGIVRGNLIIAIAGFLFAVGFDFNITYLILTLLGISLVIASAAIFNNVLDREIDAKMARTKDRAIASKKISIDNALTFASFLVFAGLTLLYLITNLLTVAVGLVGFINYVLIYTPLKKRSPYSTLAGTIPGSTSIVAGYTAATNNLDEIVLVLFMSMVFWQLAHFHSIGLFRKDEYKQANIPVLAVKKSLKTIKERVNVYIVLFTISAVSLIFLTETSPIYVALVALVNGYWLYKNLTNKTTDYIKWGRPSFKLSLVSLLIFCVVLSLNQFFIENLF